MVGMMFRRTNGAIEDGVAEKEFAMTWCRFAKSWLEYYSSILSYLARLWLYCSMSATGAKYATGKP